MSNDNHKEDISELIADSKELIAVLTALLEKAEGKLAETRSGDGPEEPSEPKV